MQTVEALHICMGRVRLGTKTQGQCQGIVAPRNRPCQCQKITDQHPPHQSPPRLRNGPAPKRSDTCATEITAPAPSAARMAAV